VKILLLGKNGLLGSAFLSLLTGRAGHELFAVDKDQLDVTDSGAVENAMKNVMPELVINCAAYTDVDGAEDDREAAFQLNAEVPGVLAKLCQQSGATLLQFSTDYVFDGHIEEGYREDSPTSPINVYGESKLQGEQNVSENTGNFYIVRLSLLFGEARENFVDRVLRGADKNKREIDVVDDYTSCPTYTADLAQGVMEIIVEPKLPFGIYHMSNLGHASRWALAKEIINIKDLKTRVMPASADRFPTPAQRPHSSILINTKTKSLRNWQEALKVYIDLK
jgi:dTDP-4-dehydrorhamnose reductase